ncbi:MAG: hypothetical protein IKE46_11110 [Selenomonadaceae bacterium]|nr:hypothetical protein [Selenomonadaceae bacterium]
MAKKNFNCIACGKLSLSKNEIGINKKLLGMKTQNFYCLECLANFLEVEPQDILDKIEDFKNDGCKLFE